MGILPRAYGSDSVLHFLSPCNALNRHPLKAGPLSQEVSIAAGSERFAAAVVSLDALSQPGTPMRGDILGTVDDGGNFAVTGTGVAAIDGDESVAQVQRSRCPMDALRRWRPVLGQDAVEEAELVARLTDGGETVDEEGDRDRPGGEVRAFDCELQDSRIGTRHDMLPAARADST
jgi:hypothetical protein